MAEVNMAEGFHELTKVWIDSHMYVGIPGQSLNTVLVASEHVSDNAAQAAQRLLEVDCGFGYFRVVGFYDSSKDTFQCKRVYLIVPKFGEVAMISDVLFNLKDSNSVKVDLGKAAKGSIQIEYYGANELVAFKYKLNVDFAGNLEDTIGLFPVKQTATTKKFPRKTSDVGAIRRSLEVQAAKRLTLSNSSGSGRTPEEEAQVTLLDSFLTDFVRDGRQGAKIIAIQTYYPKNPIRGIGISESYTASFNFAILEVALSVTPVTLTIAAGLFVKVPIAGRINLIDLSGSLLNNEKVKARIDVYVATGDVVLYAKARDDGDHDLYISFTLDVALFGRIAEEDFYLVTLP